MTDTKVRSATGAAHLYVHLPFCAHRCGYCDFVTVVGRSGEHVEYVEALLVELRLRRGQLAADVESVFVGGGTPTFTSGGALAVLLEALPAACEVTVEANPESVTPALARVLATGGVTRVSLGAQSFQDHLLAVLERRAGPDDIRRAVHTLRDAGFDNVSLDLLYGIPGQSAADLHRDLDAALALAPEHLSCYELEAKPGTRFTRARGGELAVQADAMDGYFEHVVDVLTTAGYRWYETANFCRTPERAGGRDLRCRHNLAVWRGRDYLGLGIGAVSTARGVRWQNRPSLGAYLQAARDRRLPAREVETLDPQTRMRERVMLGLRLDEPFDLGAVEDAIDADALTRLERRGLVERHGDVGAITLELTRRGRFLGGGVTADLLA